MRHILLYLVQSRSPASWKLYLLFYGYLVEKFCIRSKLILSNLKLPQLFQMNVHHLVMMTSQRQPKNVWWKSWSLNFCCCGFTFLHAWNSETVPWKSPRTWNLYIWNIHQELESVYGTSSCSYDTVCQRIWCFQSGKTDLRDKTRSGAPKTAMNENAIELVRHAIADDPHISIQERTEICYLSHGTIHWIIHEQPGMKKVCAMRVSHFLTGAEKNGEWDMLNRCLPFLNRKDPNDWLMWLTGRK